MRVLLTTDTIGGVWTFTRELTLGLLQRGHAVALVSLGRVPSLSQCAWTSHVRDRYESTFQYMALSTPLEWMEENDIAYSDAESLLLRIIEEFSVEVVHTSQFCFGALPTDVPKVVTAHSDVLTWAEVCRPVGLKDTAWLRQYRSLVEAGLEGADAVVAPTHWMRDALTRHFPASSGMQVILNGRNLTQGGKNEARQVQAIAVGRAWDEAKGFSVLSGLQVSMPILVAGETHFQRTQTQDLKQVEFLGKLEEDEVLALLRRSSLYLATSIYEPFGLAPLEAALCGCGVVARDIGSLREVWGSAAEYFKDSETLSRLLFHLRETPKALRALQDRSMERALKLSADSMIDGYIAQYKKLLSRVRVHEEVAAYAG